MSRDTIANAYERERRHVIRLGRARATRYAARQVLAGLGTDEFPVFRIDETGRIAPAGHLITLAATESVWLPEENIIDGIPPVMHDIAPKGFLAHSYLQQHADLSLPSDVADWSNNHILIALSRRGEDLPGNLVIGSESFDRFQYLTHQSRSSDDFTELAEKAIDGEHVGSSAGGEQPKFTAFVDGQHRIVKFATDTTDNARRWQDLLALEHLALRTLENAGINAAITDVIDLDGLRCLVIDRFDRVGEKGRKAVMTLAAASERFDTTWADSAVALHKQGLLAESGTHRVALLDAYGALIANTDRHHYNVGFFPTQTGYEVAPAFDQLPMAYAPPASGNLRNSAVEEPRPSVNTLAVWDEAQRLEQEFWRRAEDLQLTPSMRTIVMEHSRRLQKLAQ